MKKSPSRVARFLSGKGFYLVLAGCMVAIGFAAYSALDAIAPPKESTEPSPKQSYEQSNDTYTVPSTNPTPVTTPTPATTQKPTEPVAEEQPVPADAPAVAEKFTAPFKGTVLKDFDDKTLQYSKTYEDLRLHTALDLCPQDGLLVNSCGDGTVASIDEGTAMGTVITVDHGNGLFLRYCGVKNVKVAVGDTVSMSQPLAEIGVVTNECADEAHLHLEASRDGTPISPATLFE